MEPFIVLEKKDAIAIIKLNRPKQLNALNLELNQLLLDAIRSIQKDTAIRALILTGSGNRAFAAGADITDMVEATPQEAKKISQLAISINNTLEDMTIPTIAAVNGLALGGGMELALSCDFRVGGPRTVFAFPEVGLGVIPGANGCVRIVSLLGPSQAKQLILSGDSISGKKALDAGLLNWFAEGNAELNEAALEAQSEFQDAKMRSDNQLEEIKTLYMELEARAATSETEAVYKKALTIASHLSEKPAAAVAAAKAVISCTVRDGIGKGKKYESEEFSMLFGTHDQREGMRAMLEKRKAVFTHR